MGYSEYKANSYRPGKPWAICDRCSFKRRHDELKKEWTGLLVCDDCFDPRPAQLDAPNVYPEGLPIPNARPDNPGTNQPPNFLAVFDENRDGPVEPTPEPLPQNFPLNPFPLEADFLAVYRKYRNGDS